MGVTLEQKFKGKEQYVVNLVGQMGYDSVMKMYGVKHRKTFLRWYAENSNNEHPHNPFEDLDGAGKHSFDKEHINTIIDCVQIFGEDWVKANFHFSHDTLYRLIRFGRQDDNGGATHKELQGIHKEFERLEFLSKAEHLDYVDSIERMRQLEIAVVRFAQMIASQLASDLTPVIEQAFKVKPKQLEQGKVPVDFLSMKEARAYLGVNRTKMWHLVRDKIIPVYDSPVNKSKKLILKSDLDKFNQPRQIK